MTIAVGLDFGSIGVRSAYVLNGQAIMVPSPADSTIAWALLIPEQSHHSPIPVTFSSLKHLLGTNRVVHYRGGVQPLELLLRGLFTQIRQQIETYAGESIARTTIAIPALYSSTRRDLLRRISEDAGFGKIELINDSTAAAIAYITQVGDLAQTLLIYSMGYIGYEVSLLRVASGQLREIAHEGDHMPSGREITQILLHSVADQFYQRGAISSWDDPAWLELYQGMERLKEIGSHTEKDVDYVKMQLPSYPPFGLTFSRASFEKEVDRLILRTITSVENLLEENNLSPSDIGTALMTGGSTQLAPTQRRLRALFGDRLVALQPTAIARGAALFSEYRAERRAAAPSPGPQMQPVTVPPSPGLAPAEGGAESAPLRGKRGSNLRGDGSLPAPVPITPVLDHARLLASRGHQARAREYLKDQIKQIRSLLHEIDEGGDS